MEQNNLAESTAEKFGAGTGAGSGSAAEIKNVDIDTATSTRTSTSCQVSPTVSGSENIRIEDVYELLGGFSYFQLAATLVMILPEIPAGMLAILPVFTGTNSAPFFCEQQQQQNVSSLHFAQQILIGMDPVLCSKECVFRSPAETTFTSVVQEWDLICEYGWISDTFTSIQMAGMMTGGFLASQMADLWGRKKAFYSMSLLMAVFGIASGLVTDIYTFSVTKFLTGIGVGGFYAVYNIYLIEFLTPNWRTIVGCVSIWCIGEMLLALLAYLIPSWRLLTIAASIPAIFTLITYPVIPESPRWLLCKRRTKEASQAFQQIAKMNLKEPLDMKTVEALQESIIKEESMGHRQDEDKDRDPESNKANKAPMCATNSVFGIIWSDPKLRLRLPLFLFGWFSCALVYYGISFNTKNLSGDPYINVFYLGLVDMPAFPSGILFSNWLGRKKTFCMFLSTASIFLVALVVVEEIVGLEEYPLLITILCFCARFGAGGAWGIVTCFTAEAFPTVVRSTCLGLCCLFANVGGMVAPQLAYLGTISPALPYFIFCGFMVCSAGTSYFLGETRGKPLKNFAH